MATTTNYGWTTPDDTALVKDGASAIRTLGSSIDTTTKALNPSTTLGDIEYRSSTANTNTRLGIGTTGQVLTVSGGVPAWATISSSPASASSYVSTAQSTSSSSYTGLTTAQSVTLTTGTKVMVCISAQAQPDTGSGDRSAFMSYAISGATTKSSADNQSAVDSNRTTPEAGTYNSISAVYFETVTAGSNTFTLQFKSSSGSSSFQRRQLLVIDLGS